MYDLLLVEDDLTIREVISNHFSNIKDTQINLFIATDGNTALEMLYEKEYDLVLLDIMLPGIDGFGICREIRKRSDIPIIFLTAMGQEEDILRGYDLGCDDYIVKPFSLVTLYAKVRALLNRSKGTILSQEIKIGELTLNPRTMQVRLSNVPIDLPPKEYMILKILMENSNTVILREQLLLRIWGYDYDGDDRVLDNHIKKLRNALDPYGKIVKTVIGRGYKIQNENNL